MAYSKEDAIRFNEERFDFVTNKLIAIMEAAKEKGEQWDMPWHKRAGEWSRPVNALTKKEYNGINVLALSLSPYKSNVWATKKQWIKLGFKTKGIDAQYSVAKWTPATFIRENEETGEEEVITGKRGWWKHSMVLNAEQVGYEEEFTPIPSDVEGAENIELLERFAASTGIETRHGGNAAYYSPVGHYVQIPLMEQFKATKYSSATVNYYCTRFHEYMHATSHPTILNRQLGKRFGDKQYAREELIAELGASFLCAALNVTLEPRADHAQYLNSWIAALKGDNQLIFTVTNQAKNGANWLLEKAGML